MRCCIGLLLLLLARGASAEEVSRVYLEEFRLGHDTERVETWRELDPERAVSGCRALGFDCSDEPDPTRAATRFIKVPTVSGLYRGTARMLRQSGGSYYAAFEAPPGFRVCKAGIDIVGGLISPGAIFSGSIQRAGGDRLGVYAALSRDEGTPGRIAFRLLVATVPREKFDPDFCWPDGTILFLCLGEKRCQASRSYPEAELR
jgi:hypothetical protein